jgi:hypothetical protein
MLTFLAIMLAWVVSAGVVAMLVGRAVHSLTHEI